MIARHSFPAFRGYPIKLGVKLITTTVSGTQSAIDLAGWDFACAAKAVDTEETQPSRDDAVAFEPDVEIASPQSGDTKGVIYISVPPATTDDLEDDLFAWALAALPNGGDWTPVMTGNIQLFNVAVENPDADAASVILPEVLTVDVGSGAVTGTSPLIQVVDVGAIAAASSGLLRRSVSANLATTGDKDLYTATGDTVVRGVNIRLSSVASYSSAPRVRLKSSAGGLFTNFQSLTGFNTTSELYRLTVAVGTAPLLANGHKLQLEVETAAGAATFTCAIDVEGYTL